MLDATRLVERLPGGYADLFRRAREVLAGDERVRAMWLGGSLARGDADAASDLDVIVTVADDSRQEFATAWRSWLQQISPTVLAEELPFAAGSFFSITPAFLRLDVVVESMSELPTTFFRQRVVVFDRDGLGDMLPAPHQGPGPSGDTVGALIREFFRISAVETILARDDWLLAREHLHVLSSLIYRLFVEANAPLPPMGVKQWSTKLTADQQRALLSLPTAAANRAELARSHQMAADVFLTNAGSLAARLGIPWPDDLERAARRHLQDHLGLEDPYPRTATIVV